MTGKPDEPEDPEGIDTEVDSAVDPVRRRRKLTRARQREEDSKEFWRAVFATPIGRAEMWGILREARAFEQRFACSPTGFPDPHATWFAAGEQALGHRLFLSWLKLDREGVTKMLEEHDDRLKETRRK